MQADYIIGNIDAVELVLYAFFLFFAGLVYYLRMEDRREGYPLVSEETGQPEGVGPVWIPDPKVFRLHGGETVSTPTGGGDDRPIKAEKQVAIPGSPLVPTGNPLLDGVGPASYAMRQNVPDVIHDGTPKIQPMRVASDFSIAEGEPNIIGIDVIASDRKVAGKVADIWVDRGEHMIRYLEVELTAPTPAPAAPAQEGEEDVTAAPAAARRVLLPMTFARLNRRIRDYQILVGSIVSSQFDDVPGVNSPDQITRLEEERIIAYYGGGHLYATPERQEPLI